MSKDSIRREVDAAVERTRKQKRVEGAFGRVTRAKLRKQGRTITWLADAVGVSRAHMNKVLSGDRELTAEIREKVAQALGEATHSLQRYHGRTIRMPSRLRVRMPELPYDNGMDEFERAWLQSWLDENGEQAALAAAQRAWVTAMIEAGIDPVTRRPRREDD